jgi:DNA-directed RNA polymerase specialized sigma24 family protein
VTRQLDLIQEPLPPLGRPAPAFRRSDPETSQRAAAAAQALAGEQNERILAALLRLPGRAGTYYEIAAEAGLTPIQVARRLGHRYGLVGATLVEVTEEVRQLPSRRMGHVYRLAGTQ